MSAEFATAAVMIASVTPMLVSWGLLRASDRKQRKHGTHGTKLKRYDAWGSE